MTKRMIFMLILLFVGVLALGAMAGIEGFTRFEAFKAQKIKEYMAAHGPPPQTVSTATAEFQAWQPKISAVGSLRAVNGADLSAQVAGIVAAIHFESGQDVSAGAPLVELVAADDLAKLKSLKAVAALARITYERDLKQFKAQAVSQQTVDADEQTLKSDEAQVSQQQALVDYKFIRAPFAGRLGIRQVDLGQYLPAGTTMVTLQQLDPIFVDFYLPQQALDKIKIGQAVIAKADTYPHDTFTGTITAINSKVDTATRNVQVRAVLKNAERKLLPGMFATVEIDTGAPERHITLPQTAIAYNPYGSTVYLVDIKGRDPAGKPILVARQTFVTTGATRGDQVAVLSGVTAGETVVTAGQIKLHNGSPVAINNSIRPTDDPNPQPVDH